MCDCNATDDTELDDLYQEAFRLQDENRALRSTVARLTGALMLSGATLVLR